MTERCVHAHAAYTMVHTSPGYAFNVASKGQHPPILEVLNLFWNWVYAAHGCYSRQADTHK